MHKNACLHYFLLLESEIDLVDSLVNRTTDGACTIALYKHILISTLQISIVLNRYTRSVMFGGVFNL
jgi:hypothetical protein